MLRLGLGLGLTKSDVSGGAVVASLDPPVSSDISSAVVAAYGFDRVVEGFSGDTVRLKRASDNAESNFGFDSQGKFDTSAVDTWAASGNVLLVRCFDQGGSAVTFDVTGDMIVRNGTDWNRFATTNTGWDYIGTNTSGTAIITGISSTTGIEQGMDLTGTGIPDNSYVVSVDSTTQITISQNTTSAVTAFNVQNNQLTRSTTQGGVGAYTGASNNGYLRTSTNLTADSTAGLEFHILWSHDERKVRGASVGSDNYNGNADDESLFAYGLNDNNYVTNIIGIGSGTDYYRIRTNGDSNLNIETSIVSYKQYAQYVASFAFTGTTQTAYHRGGSSDMDDTLAAATQTDIASGTLDDGDLVFGNRFTGTSGGVRSNDYLNGLFGGIIVTTPLTATQRFLLQMKLKAVGQQHRIATQQSVLDLFDEIVLSKNVNAATGVLVGENNLITLNHDTATNPEGTPDWDFEYTLPNLGIQGIRSPTSNDANGFLASDNYFAGTTTGSVLGIYYSESSGNNLPVAYAQTGGNGRERDGSRSFSLGFEHGTVSFETTISQARDDNNLIGTRLKADETTFGYDLGNQEQGKYNNKTAHGGFVFDESFDSETWTAARWRNDTGNYALDGDVVPHTNDNISYQEKDNRLVLQFGTFEAPSGFDRDAAYSVRKTYNLQADTKSYVTDGMNPVLSKDGDYAHNPFCSYVDSLDTSKIGSEHEASGTFPPFVGTRVAFGCSTAVWTVENIETIDVNAYKLLF